ncbi:MAG: M20/M25/M40 family metallo-hydrolase [Candidatus Micrarchaeota archaeon]|nr:M20/M25/M40 family metallo-hydrolase [Candidatus Micrarchaeota archaeon]MDE1859888.1 M20/M25/M40 family metallo-hydrolase [Candidatus Micrarchaeota archaeon]
MGFSVTTQQVGDTKGRNNIFAEREGKSTGIMFYGHIDTVNLVNPDQWQTDPYEAVAKSGRIYGLGSGDMKGGLSCFISAASQSQVAIKIFLAVDEENWSEGAWTALKNNPKFFKDVNLVISAEPGFGLDTNQITVGRTGRILYEVSFAGRPTHIINYRDAIDAIELAGIFLNLFYSSRNRIFASPDSIGQARRIAGEAVGMSVCGHSEVEM